MTLLEKVDYLQREFCPFHADPNEVGRNRLERFATVSDPITQRNFVILRCPACGAGLTDPFPSPETVHYLYLGRESETNFDPIRGTFMDAIKGFFARSDMRRAANIGGLTNIATVLDYGAGSGRFSLACLKAFADCTVDALDFDESSPPHLVGVQGIRYIHHGDYVLENKRYDFILLRGVLEHVHDPASLLRSLGDRLNDGGVLYVEAPNIDSAYIHYFGARYNGYAVPYHLFNFSDASLRWVIQTAGLNAQIATVAVPLAGCTLAAALKHERRLVHQVAGIVLHPIQILLDAYMGKYQFAAVCKNT